MPGSETPLRKGFPGAGGTGRTLPEGCLCSFPIEVPCEPGHVGPYQLQTAGEVEARAVTGTQVPVGAEGGGGRLRALGAATESRHGQRCGVWETLLAGGPCCACVHVSTRVAILGSQAQGWHLGLSEPSRACDTAAGGRRDSRTCTTFYLPYCPAESSSSWVTGRAEEMGKPGEMTGVLGREPRPRGETTVSLSEAQWRSFPSAGSSGEGVLPQGCWPLVVVQVLGLAHLAMSLVLVAAHLSLARLILGSVSAHGPSTHGCEVAAH